MAIALLNSARVKPRQRLGDAENVQWPLEVARSRPARGGEAGRWIVGRAEDHKRILSKLSVEFTVLRQAGGDP